MSLVRTDSFKSADELSNPVREALAATLLSLADNKRILGMRYGEWILGAPTLESGIACSAMAQDEWGHGRILYATLKDFGLDPGVLIKTGIMLGLGENSDDVRGFMDDALAAGVQILTLGQYLRPTEKHLPIDRYVGPEEFDEWKRLGEELGFLHVESGPLVRSSYHAREQIEQLRARAGIA